MSKLKRKCRQNYN